MKNINRECCHPGRGQHCALYEFHDERENGGMQYNAFKIANALGTGDVAPTEALAGLGRPSDYCNKRYRNVPTMGKLCSCWRLSTPSRR
jgi:hypothetical protein